MEWRVGQEWLGEQETFSLLFSNPSFTINSLTYKRELDFHESPGMLVEFDPSFVVVVFNLIKNMH